MTQDTEFTSSELISMLQQALRHNVEASRLGVVRADGDLATVNVMLPNGQTFRVSVEETTGL